MNGTKDRVLKCYVGDTPDKCQLVLYTDAMYRLRHDGAEDHGCAEPVASTERVHRDCEPGAGQPGDFLVDRRA